MGISQNKETFMTDFAVENKVIVKIFGEEYPLAATDDAGYISKIADYVDSKMNEVARRSRSRARDKVAILTALSIASELFEKSDDVSQAVSQYDIRLDKLLARLDGALHDSSSKAS